MKTIRLKSLFVALALSGAAGSGHAHSVGWISSSELDSKISPCADLNGFVNTSWIAANPIPPDRTRWGAFDQVSERSLDTQHEIAEAAAKDAAADKTGSNARKIGWLYRSGMDETAVEKAGFDPIKPDLAKIDTLKTSTDLVAFLREDFARGRGIVFQFGARADYNDAKTQIASTSQGGLGLPTPDYYSKDDYADLRKAYVAHIAKTLQLTGVAADDAARQADVVMKVETRLAAASLSRVELRDPKNQYHFVTIAEADQATPHFPWAPFFAAQGAHVEKGFSLSQPKFFAEFDRMLADVPVADWQAYLRFHVIDGASPYLSKAFEDENYAFYGQTLNGQKEQQPRWKRVLEAVNGGMGQALGELYVAKTFPPEAKARAQALIDDVRSALKARIENLDWMSAETKQKALAKWQTFLPKIGYPDKWRDWSGLKIAPDDYFANVRSARQFNYDYDVAKIGKPTDRLEWRMTPQTVNAYYSPTDNTINFPAAILQPPFFDFKADDALNFGGIGAVIGHESTHGYDDQGSKFDPFGNNHNWWTAEDRTQFDARTQKLADQFNAYEPLPGKHVNGQLTLGENIADLGGLNVAYDALQVALKKNPGEARAKIDGYTEDQRFFIAFARVWAGNILPKAQEVRLNTDPHAPAKYRAIGAPSNMPTYAQAFACKAGDAMVRNGDVQVKIW
ncbi:MAG TPA: M13-type metalloendopeptidase [Rhodanobacteraceae bacterium]|jgi:putative endopeptidase|nr:M13-type metalloendopeptidase [Rhodanobacteraceae bacterium]